MVFKYKHLARTGFARKYGTMGEYILDAIPPVLANTLQEHIIVGDYKTGDFIFSIKDDRTTSPTGDHFSFLVRDQIFGRYTGVKMSITRLRKSYTSFVNFTNLTSGQQDRICFMMGTSSCELMKTYFKKDLVEQPKGEHSSFLLFIFSQQL
jgi:hypothetical protein